MTISSTDLTAVSLFAGIGGFDLALERAGVKVAAAVEIDPACRGVLRRRFPQTAIFNDVREVTGDQFRAAGFVPGRGVLCGGFPCFAAGTRILTAAGWLPIEDVHVGDLVLTHAGRWMPVTSTMSRVADHQVVVRGQGIPQIVTTSEHPFYARSSSRVWVGRGAGSWRREFGEPAWVDAEKMAGQFAGQVLPPEETDDHSADLWWLAGRYLADGWTTTGSRRPSGVYKGNRVVICCAHEEADYLAERIGRVVHATRSEDITATKFVITQARFVDFLDRFGRGAAGKTLTRRELALPADKAEALLAGWLSGDGCRTQGQWKGTTVSRSLALSMALLAQRARGVVASLHETAMPSSDVIAGRAVGQRTQYQVVVPDRNRSAFIEGEYGWKLVRSATRTDGPVLVYNLSVGGDESYVADGAVVHNCQDLSVAGRRAGLGGARSGLFWEIMRLADELSPRWLLLENVPGLLSAVCSCPGDEACVANGRAVRCGEWRTERVPGPADELLSGDSCPVCGHEWDVHDAGDFCAFCQDTCVGLPAVRTRRVFIARVPHQVKKGACPGGCMESHGGAMGTVLGALGERGYGFAYRVLDAQFFGVPQRRRRVFIAGCLGDQAGPVEVLLEPEGGQRNPAKGHAPRADVAGTLGSRLGGSRTTDLNGHGAYVTGALTRGSLADYDDNTAQAGQLVAHALTAREGKGPDSDATSGFIVASTLQGGGRRGHRVDVEGAAGGHLVAATLTAGTTAGDARPPGRRAAQITHPENRVNPQPGDPNPPLAATGQPMVAGVFPVALRGRDGGSQAECGEPGDPAFTVRTPGGGSSYPMVAHFAAADGITGTLRTHPRPGSADPGAVTVTHALTAEGADASEDGTGRGTPLVAVPMAFNPQNSITSSATLGYSETPPAVTANKVMAVQEQAAVRRLTPVECERLQGFPDDWTRWLDDGTEQSDSARYRACGNAVAVPVVEWIARRVVAVKPAGVREVRSGGHYPASRGASGYEGGLLGQEGLSERKSGTEAVEAWRCADDCPVAELDRQSGVLTSGANPARRGSDKFRDAYGEFSGQQECTVYRGADAGGASRFFPAFRYEAKAGAAERPRLDDGTAHPTVKPLDLMRWLVRLVTPPGGVVLDPFAGTGTTGEACIIEGFRCVLIERDPKYADLIMVRLRKPIQPDLFGGAV